MLKRNVPIRSIGDRERNMSLHHLLTIDSTNTVFYGDDIIPQPPIIKGLILRRKSGIEEGDAEGRSGNPNSPPCSGFFNFHRASNIGLVAIPLEPRGILHRYRISPRIAFWNGAWMYGEMGGLSDVTLPGSAPGPKYGYNFLDSPSIESTDAVVRRCPFWVLLFLTRALLYRPNNGHPPFQI